MMRAQQAGAAVIIDAGGRIAGILTERDISRRMAFRVAADTAVSQVMTAPVETIAASDHLHNAVARMRRGHIRHLPVVASDHTVIGLLELEAVLANISGRALTHIDLLNPRQDLASIRETKANQFRIAADLLADDVPAGEIQQLLTRLNQQLYDVVIERCLQIMQQQGLDPPPVPFDVIIMGSGGRSENYLAPDQDNGFIIADYPDSEHNRIDSWFRELATHMTDTLNAIGFPYCHGHVMADNPLWRKTLSQWRQQVSRWIGKGDGNFLRLCDIFFDFVCVCGRGELTANLREHITSHAAHPFFLRQMYQADEDHDVALGPFGWLLTERRKGPDKGKLNLKLNGTLPLVGAVRILALRQRVTETSTLQRIAALQQQGVVNNDERDYLCSAYRHISFLLLRQQLRDAGAGLVPGNYVHPKQLSRRERDVLVGSFKAIRAFRARLRTELTGDIF
jgi:signal-transduction protein with cAMP-binding, CBS, and nucleotidyltransferase domain